MTAQTCPCPEIPAGRAFWCERHACRKNAHLRALCLQRGAYWRAWEANRGPGQARTPEQREAARRAIKQAEFRRALGRQTHLAMVEARRKPGDRPTELVALILDRCAPAGSWPCGIRGREQEKWIADVLNPAAWRPEWGEPPTSFPRK